MYHASPIHAFGLRSAIVDKGTGPTYVPKVLVGTISVQPVLLHIIQRRTCSLLNEQLGTRVKLKLSTIVVECILYDAAYLADVVMTARTIAVLYVRAIAAMSKDERE